MSSFRSLSAIWKNVKEVELRPIQQEAMREVRLALVGSAGSGRHTLAAQMRSDPHRPVVQTYSPLLILDETLPEAASNAHLIILMLDATRQEFSVEQALAQQWINSGKKVLVFWNKLDLLMPNPMLPAVHVEGSGFIAGSAIDSRFLLNSFVPQVLKLLPDHHLSLGRLFPLFRLSIAHQLIYDTCLSNSAYAFSTGLAEAVPGLGLPLNVADTIVLTKAQAFLVYRLGLLLGFTDRWQDYVTEFGGVIGGGFLWRQLARSLVGLVPVWGIIPKVAVAYAGTYVVGHAVLQWYLSGRHISREQIQALYRQALVQGRQTARRLVTFFDHLRPRRRKKDQLPQSALSSALPEHTSSPVENLVLPEQMICARCGRSNASDAVFCQYCGKKLTVRKPPKKSLSGG